MARLPCALLLLATLASLAPLRPATAHHAPMCLLSYCECTPAAHPSWTTVNCTVPNDQKLDIMEGDLPDSTTDLVITGAEAVMFGANSLSRLQDARHVRLSGVKVILMRRFAALNLNVVSLYLEIDHSDVIRIEERTFSSIRGPLSVMITECDYVSVEGTAFSWLLMMNMSNIRHLEVGPESFTLDPTAANVGEHGPGMLIQLKNLTVAEFPAQTFGSSAAGITMDAVEVRAVRAGAFTANTYTIVMAVNSSFHLIEGDAFAQKSLINNLQFHGCSIQQLSSNALQSGVTNLNVSHCKIENVETGAINATFAVVAIQDSEFHTFEEKGFELSSWNKLIMERNSFDELPAHAIVATGTSIHKLVFTENEIETANPDSLAFIGQAHANFEQNIKYRSNYFGQACNCNISSWLSKVIATEDGQYEDETLCTVDEFFARCFNVPEQNMVLSKFLDSVCTDKMTIQCEAFTSQNEGEKEIKNPRFPHKHKEEGGLTARNAKVIGIVIVTCFGCVLLVMVISLIRWMRRKGYCVNVKNFLISSNSSCGAMCDRLCSCGRNSGIDNARSISQLSVHEYSERHRLNEPRVQEVIQETALPDIYTEQVVPTEEKTTQTLPEELTKELLENLKEKLEDPENYVEAREMIEHLYELIKVEENCNVENTAVKRNTDENIYDLPFQNTAPRMGKNKKKMISVGTKTPSLEQLQPLSPYNRQTALAHEYFEPKDFAVHLYAEIANCDKEKKNLLGAMPDVVGDQAKPRGPYLRAVRDKMNSSASSSPSTKSQNSSITSPQHMSSMKSVKSNGSGKMMNRPLPEKPAPLDPGEGTSFKLG
ncbi:uncharacterized protein LOC126380079 [Pectinophora gossypiella]|uniref:uncharacterized protein LOC126380079 n=1 Tax=Pectinophora gossypiella TaxID=13191 RepID=UPI00214F56F1|nr:uncharacterized protein LOC126380079 [Pectinophora gossypiella]